ncbi:3-hydroxyacyl-CoA dehydrogenase [Rhodococcus sp. 06-156-3C]|uniref:3-hydroxyacyl-CoA dehydrogenase NAD-binding domain-containing protein n=1 Tax=Nocardiaceae TaxID=85025 RepID=UPI000522EE86|nr:MULTISPECIES: 3-hydroxyacyl-CoA dehydrogenase NAD-binding domain-containing protein [Rhodococcus]OZD11632.1 3-hydroxyacyl-CoA dehydrogenase [Rhodococcus sp. 06-156-4C]OZD15474.1 3-hydroxyacyl-CoA dehydrogenase [Rhodococcus sp. 06-156-4a]OZD23640.1 3-hydroxyacyl-CoA dehydrogenase [Rhodococcus sp. 06-156-3C]OZD27288.1 3-hydroxyacyl-CoA dehydrogenase [Rhodococcus sp. 06-156-3b]OZD31316.1 3-hydroxyacyl-CoA dehydrogenase [Rhodococcus sp. 06-156-3]
MTTTSVPICVVGAGTMGRGIAQTALAAGHHVSLVDPLQTQLTAAASDIESRLAKRHPEIAAQLPERLTLCVSIDQAPPAPDTVVIEAVLESLDVKSTVFDSAANHFGKQCILATNTSSLSVSEIAARSPLPDRVVGMHFFNPVPVMKLVEVVSALQTIPPVSDFIAKLAESWGKQVVRVKNAPGFIVNRVARGFYGEPLRLIQENVASPATLDAAIRDGGQFRMGPFELMDLIGNDVNAAVTRTVWTAFNFDPRFEPSRIQDELVSAGRYGRKRGQGFYSYEDGATRDLPTTADVGIMPEKVVMNGSCDALDTLVARAGIDIERTVPKSEGATGELSMDGITVLVTRGRTARAESAARGGSPVVLIDRCISMDNVVGIAVSASDPETLPALAALMDSAGITVYPIADVPGLVLARTLAVIANEAWETTLHGVASEDDIDVAMKLGTNYPAGPFEWTTAWSRATLLNLLDELWDAYHDGRYRASRSLRDPATG